MNKKRLLVYAGVNGSGKTTLHKISQLGSLRINPDEIIVAMSGDWKNSTDQFKSAKQCLLQQKECFEKGVSFHRESTLCSHEIINSIKKAVDLNYYVTILFVGVSTVEIAKERVEIRVKKGGHGIDETLIEKRFIKSKNNIISVARKFPVDIYFYDNSKSSIFMSASYVKGSWNDYVSVEWVKELKREIID